MEVHRRNGNVAIGVLQQLGPPKVKAQKSQPDDTTRAETDNGPVGHMDDDDNVTIPPGMCVPPGAKYLKSILYATLHHAGNIEPGEGAFQAVRWEEMSSCGTLGNVRRRRMRSECCGNGAGESGSGQ